MKMLRPAIVKRKLEVLDEDERLMAESPFAVTCFDLEELFKDCINLYGDICRLDDNFHATIFENPDQYSPEIASSMKGLFSKWHDVVSRSFALFESIRGEFRDREINVKIQDELRRCFSECNAILNPSNVESDRLAEEAISQHRQGLTVGM